MKIKINITPSTNKHWIGAEVSMENSTEMQTDEHNIHGCDQLSHLLRKMLGFTDDSYQGLWFFCPSQSDVLAITKGNQFPTPLFPSDTSIPQCYTSLIPLHNPPPPLPNIYTPLTLSPILQPSLQTEGLPIFTQPLVVVI